MAMLYQSMTDADYSLINITFMFIYGISLTADYDQSMVDAGDLMQLIYSVKVFY